MKNQRILIIIVSLILVAGLLNCGKDNPADGGDPPSPPPPQEDPMKVDSDGGSVSNEDNTVTLSIPSGSLSSEVTFTIGETTSHPGDAVGTVYDIGPDGTGFDPAATLTLSYDEADLPSGVQESELVLATVENNSWTQLTTTIDEQNNKVSAEIEHLSVYGIIWNSQALTTIGPEGGTITSEDQKAILEIPEGALSTEVTFSIEETGDHPEGNRGTAYKIGPSGTVFEEALATLTIYYDENLLGDNESEEYLKLATVGNNTWTELNTTLDVQNNTATALISHLSVFGLVWNNPNEIGAEGGIIKSEDGLLTLAIPEGALTDKILFSVTETDEQLADILGKAYTIGPEGTEFQQPAGMSITYNQLSLPSGTVEEQLVIVRKMNGVWFEQPTQVNIFNNTLRTEISATGTYSIREIFEEPMLTLYTGYQNQLEEYVKPQLFSRVFVGNLESLDPPFIGYEFRDSSAVPPPLFNNPTDSCQPVERTLQFSTFVSSEDGDKMGASGTFSINKTSGETVGFSYSGMAKADYIAYHADPNYLNAYSIESLVQTDFINWIGNGRTYLLIKVENPSNKRVRLTFNWENSVNYGSEGPQSVGYRWAFSTSVYKAILNNDCTVSTPVQLDIPIESLVSGTTRYGSTESGLTGTDDMILQADIKTYYLALFPRVQSEANAVWWRVGGGDGTTGYGNSHIEGSGNLTISIETL